MLKRYPHAFSGGQRQRLSIARAMMLDPSLIVCDEPTSALDVSVQEQILTAAGKPARTALNSAIFFISHDLAVVARIADEVAVMRRGLIVEQAPPDTLFYNPATSLHQGADRGSTRTGHQPPHQPETGCPGRRLTGKLGRSLPFYRHRDTFTGGDGTRP